MINNIKKKMNEVLRQTFKERIGLIMIRHLVEVG